MSQRVRDMSTLIKEQYRQRVRQKGMPNIDIDGLLIPPGIDTLLLVQDILHQRHPLRRHREGIGKRPAAASSLPVSWISCRKSLVGGIPVKAPQGSHRFSSVASPERRPASPPSG